MDATEALNSARSFTLSYMMALMGYPSDLQGWGDRSPSHVGITSQALTLVTPLSPSSILPRRCRRLTTGEAGISPPFVPSP